MYVPMQEQTTYSPRLKTDEMHHLLEKFCELNLFLSSFNLVLNSRSLPNLVFFFKFMTYPCSENETAALIFLTVIKLERRPECYPLVP